MRFYLVKIKKLLTEVLKYFASAIKIVKLNSQTLPYDLNPYERFSQDEKNSSYEYFKKYFYESIFLDKHQIRDHAIKLAIKNSKKENDLFLEFGVWKGESINNFALFLKNKKIYGFDSFKGLKESWKGTKGYQKGFFETNIPAVKKNVTLVNGWFQDVLPDFIEKNKESKIKFIHIDCDTYESTNFVLNSLKDLMSEKTIILFDDFYNFSGWKVGEFKALKDNFSENEIKYLAFASDHTSVLIEINKSV